MIKGGHLNSNVFTDIINKKKPKRLKAKNIFQKYSWNWLHIIIAIATYLSCGKDLLNLYHKIKYVNQSIKSNIKLEREKPNKSSKLNYYKRFN